jgi:hypothetical protein
MGSCSNLGPNEQRKRWMTAVAALGGAALLAVVCGPASLWTRLGMGGAFVVAAFCVMQARAQTCVLLAYTGRRNLDGGSERVRDLDQRREMIRGANLVVVKALAIALAGMAVLALV